MIEVKKKLFKTFPLNLRKVFLLVFPKNISLHDSLNDNNKIFILTLNDSFYCSYQKWNI